MNKIKRVLITLITILTPILVSAETLTIDSKNYNESTNKLNVTGTSSFNDVMVSLFDSEENLLSLKTVTTTDNKYNVDFNISFSEDQTITVKVGDINSTSYKKETLNVKKSIIPPKPNKLTDENGNTLTILDNLNKFEYDSELNIELIDDFDSLNKEEKALINFIKNKLGIKKELKAVMQVMVINKGHEEELSEIPNGYKLFINVPEAFLKEFKKPYVARVLDLEEITLEKEILVSYNSEEKGIVLTLNNVGIYLIYDDITIDYKYLDKTDNQTYNLNDQDTLTLRINAEYSKFLNVYVDDKLVDPKNYTSKEGSTIITFTKEYLQTLGAGNHTIKVNFTDGEANTTVNITNVSANPKTGDNITIYMIPGLVGLIGLSLGLVLRKKKTN